MQGALPSPCLYISMKQAKALAFPHPMNDWRFHVTTRIHVIWGFLHSTHHSAKAYSIWWEKPEYYSILLECRWAIPKTPWGRWIFKFLLSLGREYCGEDIPGQGDLAWWVRKANQGESEIQLEASGISFLNSLSSHCWYCCPRGSIGHWTINLHSEICQVFLNFSEFIHRKSRQSWGRGRSRHHLF